MFCLSRKRWRVHTVLPAQSPSCNDQAAAGYAPDGAVDRERVGLWAALLPRGPHLHWLRHGSLHEGATAVPIRLPCRSVVCSLLLVQHLTLTNSAGRYRSLYRLLTAATLRSAS